MILDKKEVLRTTALSVLTITMAGTAVAKSLYVNKDLNANSPISAYDIQPDGCLSYQMTSSPTRYGGVGLGIDTDSETLFVTFEGSGTLDMVDANTLAILGRVTAPNATNLAGIVVDQDRQKVYAVDRNTNHLYVYSWVPPATLTNDVTTLSPSLLKLIFFGFRDYNIRGCKPCLIWRKGKIHFPFERGYAGIELLFLPHSNVMVF
ncbi:hypothetical protein QUF54_04925 [Candidatus Marithioploca araucensis]|uniref:Uncharacterized protein n=1 Tax=Candidatus Marithioploca araucensis TaxID=70273 RepID=A0ABT7VSY1_9GAMM|nr:hypothetical protein [Candidatus Marithioploca araucensis]